MPLFFLIYHSFYNLYPPAPFAEASATGRTAYQRKGNVLKNVHFLPSLVGEGRLGWVRLLIIKSLNLRSFLR